MTPAQRNDALQRGIDSRRIDTFKHDISEFTIIRDTATSDGTKVHAQRIIDDAEKTIKLLTERWT